MWKLFLGIGGVMLEIAVPFVLPDKPVIGYIFAGIGLIFIITAGVCWWKDRRKIVRPQDEEEPIQTVEPALEEAQTFYNAWLKPAGESGSQVLRRVLRAIRDHPDEAVSGQEGLIQKSVVDPERRALSMLNNALSGQISINDAEQLQDYIADYYRAYQGMRTWIKQGGKIAGFAFNSDLIFQEWLHLDEQFLNALRQFTGPPRYDHLRGKVAGVGWGENITNALRGLANNG